MCSPISGLISRGAAALYGRSYSRCPAGRLGTGGVDGAAVGEAPFTRPPRLAALSSDGAVLRSFDLLDLSLLDLSLLDLSRPDLSLGALSLCDLSLDDFPLLTC